MNTAEIWNNKSGLWFGHLIDPITGKPDSMLFTASSRGSVIAEMRYQIPLTHLTFTDRVSPLDP